MELEKASKEVRSAWLEERRQRFLKRYEEVPVERVCKLILCDILGDKLTDPQEWDWAYKKALDIVAQSQC